MPSYITISLTPILHSLLFRTRNKLDEAEKEESTMDEKVKLSHNAGKRLLQIHIEGLQEEDWESSKVEIDKIESWMEEGKVSIIQFHCDDPSDINLRFVMWTLNVVERYKRLEQRETEIWWNVDTKKSYHAWLREKLMRAFDLDIKFTRFLTSGGLI